ncbi:MAG: Dam family site-specific DNA-(adenine-N6)-methyltransferase [Spirochaetes bacterium]|nr:Dam family site-specific DNA-(adenine-N6)-methyltransferase [Spirochaetota bacterium]
MSGSVSTPGQPDTQALVPFLKWAGGKRWLIRNHRDFFPSSLKGTYFEPFLGGGSVFSSLRPPQSVLSDSNGELINTYLQIKRHWKHIDEGLALLQIHHSSEFYYKIRNRKNTNPLKRALRFLYLNRTCYNGLYRVNKNGDFNVPIGTRSTIVRPEDDYQGWSKALRSTELVVSDFEPMIQHAGKGDLIFADPPYTILHNQNCFLKYNEVLFSWNDQLRLAETLWKAAKRGAKIIATNANCQSVRDLYEGRFKIDVICRASTIAASSGKRGLFEEIVISSKGESR